MPPQAAQEISWDEKPQPQAGSGSADIQWDDDKKPPASEQPGVMRRFWNGVKAGTGNDPSDYTTATYHGVTATVPKVDPEHPISSNPMVPGAGVYRDIKSGDYAGAAGRVLGPAAELLPMVLGGRGRVAEPPERVPLWKQPWVEPAPAPPAVDATPMTPRPVHAPGAQAPPSAPVGPRVPLWQRAGIEPGAPPSSIDATPSEPYQPVRAPRVTAGPAAVPAQPPVEAPFKRPDLPAPYSTEQQAWRRYPAVDSAQDLAETKDIQARVKDQAEGEQRNMLRRGTEEGFARNTRPRTAKGELRKQYQSGSRSSTPSAKASGSDYPGVDLNSEKELTDLLKRSLELATKVKPRK